MPREVILGDVEHGADMGMELRNGFALIGADLGDGHIRLLGGSRRRGDRIADVAHHMRPAARRAENLADQRGRRGLAVGAGDGGQAAPAQARAKLQLADDLDAL